MPWDEAVMPTLCRRTAGTPAPGDTGERASLGVDVVRYESRGTCVIAARGDCDLHTITPLAAALKAASEEHSTVVLDASGITFADSAFLNLLILIHRTAALRLVAPSPRVRRLFEITGADTLLEIRDTVEEAVAS
ncbi:STAS domain-containing protein [Streptomyces sp. SudanB25_2051]|uniref:STAS domain-containing protein n=1 Tax=Streptomyces sp. SudanB25_2051 TaxID=3035275 RepID=UPI003F57CD3C